MLVRTFEMQQVADDLKGIIGTYADEYGTRGYREYTLLTPSCVQRCVCEYDKLSSSPAISTLCPTHRMTTYTHCSHCGFPKKKYHVCVDMSQIYQPMRGNKAISLYRLNPVISTLFNTNKYCQDLNVYKDIMFVPAHLDDGEKRLGVIFRVLQDVICKMK